MTFFFIIEKSNAWYKLTENFYCVPIFLSNDDLFSFDLEAELGDIRRFTGNDRLLSLWVYLDDLDTETNVVYVS